MNQPKPRNSDDPWEAPDPALALAIQQLRWYALHRDQARWGYRVIQLLLLITTAATTVAAALGAAAWLTATLAATTVVLTGLDKVLDVHDRWVGFGTAWAELQIAINDYRLLPPDGRDDEARVRLVAKVNEVMQEDTGRWASRRRNLAEGHRDA